ncbi:MAG: hypothetical protein RLZZ499_2698, partial [Cyanobacteriota bacterium]
MLTDLEKQYLVKQISSCYAHQEDNLKNFFWMNEKNFGTNFYGETRGESFNTRIGGLVQELILRNKLDDFIRIVRQDYPNFAADISPKVEPVPANPEQYYAELENMLRSENW